MPGPESVSSPVEPLSSSPAAFLEASWGMRVLPLPRLFGRESETGEGVSGSVELGLWDREESEWLGRTPAPPAAEWLISPRLDDFSKPWFSIITFFITMGLSGSCSCRGEEAASGCRLWPPLGAAAQRAGWLEPPASSRALCSWVGLLGSSLGAELETRW